MLCTWCHVLYIISCCVHGVMLCTLCHALYMLSCSVHCVTLCIWSHTVYMVSLSVHGVMLCTCVHSVTVCTWHDSLHGDTICTVLFCKMVSCSVHYVPQVKALSLSRLNGWGSGCLQTLLTKCPPSATPACSVFTKSMLLTNPSLDKLFVQDNLDC